MRRAGRGSSRIGILLLAASWLATVGPFVSQVEAAESIRIETVEVLGTEDLDASALEGVLTIGAGELLDRPRVVESAENLRNLLRSRGYVEAEVRSELVRRESDDQAWVLRFIALLGLPTRIVSVAMDAPKSPGAERVLREGLSGLLQSAGIRIGGMLDLDRIEALKRGAIALLESKDFLGPEILGVDYLEGIAPERVPAPPGSIEATVAPSPARSWVSLVLRVRAGDRVSFGFRGNEAIPLSRLSAVIQEQRIVGLGQDYVGVIIGRIEDEYRNLGFSQVKVTAFTSEDRERGRRHVSFHIQEGRRVAIDEIDFDGNAYFAKDLLRRQFLETAPAIIRSGWYVEKGIEAAANSLVEWIRSQGFLGARLVTVTRSPLTVLKQPRMKVRIYLAEGEQTFVRDFEVSGLTAISLDKVAKMLGVRVGEPLDLFVFEAGIEALKSRLRGMGYLDLRIANESQGDVVRYSRENREARIRLDVEEGPLYRIGKIEIQGLVTTLPEVVEREIAIKSGDPALEATIRETELAVRRLGIFSSVAVRLLETSSPGIRNVLVSVQEGTPGIVAGGLGFRNDLGARVFGQVGYTNLWERNHTVAFNLNLNRRFDEEFCATPVERLETPGQDHCVMEYQAQLSYVWPWFVAGATSFRPRITLENNQFREFDATTASFAASWERRLLPSVNLVGGLTYSLERTRQFNAVAAEDNDTLQIGALIPSIRLDLRDNSLAPTEGFYLATSYEWASTLLLSQVDPFPIGYTRFLARADQYIPLGAGMTWFLSFRTGFERNSEAPPADNPDDKRYAIPLIKQFALGGVSSLRGFNEQELNIRNIAVRGTASYVNYRTQLDLPFAGPMRFGPFLDAANLLVDQFSLHEGLRMGTGVGLHYQSPVGPVNFDLGFKIAPKPGEDPWGFYFSIGVI